MNQKLSRRIGSRLRELREERNLSQGDVERRTGLIRCYISRVENGHTIPTIQTLQKLAAGFEMPFYQLFYVEEGNPKSGPLASRAAPDTPYERRLYRSIRKMDESDRQILLHLARKMAKNEMGK